MKIPRMPSRAPQALRSLPPGKLAQSCAVGIFLACGPFLGIQIILAFCASALLRLPAAPMLGTLCLINNPLTMVPIVFVDHATGTFLLERLLHLNIRTYEPAWFQHLSIWLEGRLTRAALPSIKISASNYLIGGLCFGLLCALIAYPIMLHMIQRVRTGSPPLIPPSSGT